MYWRLKLKTVNNINIRQYLELKHGVSAEKWYTRSLGYLLLMVSALDIHFFSKNPHKKLNGIPNVTFMKKIGVSTLHFSLENWFG